jgi:hypothetical protein
MHMTAREFPEVVGRYKEEYDQFVMMGGKLQDPSSKISETYDVVLSTFTLETICRRTDRLKLLDDLTAHLRRGGRLILAVRGPKDIKTVNGKGRRCGDGYITPGKTFVKPYTVREITAVLRRRGLNILKAYGGSKQNEPQIIEIVAERR